MDSIETISKKEKTKQNVHFGGGGWGDVIFFFYTLI